MRVLVTGATGFIGAHAVPALQAQGFEVHAVGRRGPPGVVHHPADLLDPVATTEAVRAAAASHLLHLAWYVEPGVYWRSPRNLDWVGASLALVRAFAEAGGQRVVGAGTCAEYAWGPPLLPETSPLAAATLYGVAKDALRRLLEGFAREGGPSMAWGRLFYLYGPGEAPGRLVSDAIRTLSAGGRLATTHGRQRRDFLHVADAAGALAALLASGVEGAVNVAAGEAPPVREVLAQVATHTGGVDQIDFGARPLSPSEPDCIQADVSRLRHAVGFHPRFDLASGIADAVSHARRAV